MENGITFVGCSCVMSLREPRLLAALGPEDVGVMVGREGGLGGFPMLYTFFFEPVEVGSGRLYTPQARALWFFKFVFFVFFNDLIIIFNSNSSTSSSRHPAARCKSWRQGAV